MSKDICGICNKQDDICDICGRQDHICNCDEICAICNQEVDACWCENSFVSKRDFEDGNFGEDAADD